MPSIDIGADLDVSGKVRLGRSARSVLRFRTRFARRAPATCAHWQPAARAQLGKNSMTPVWGSPGAPVLGPHNDPCLGVSVLLQTVSCLTPILGSDPMARYTFVCSHSRTHLHPSPKGSSAWDVQPLIVGRAAAPIEARIGSKTSWLEIPATRVKHIRSIPFGACC